MRASVIGFLLFWAVVIGVGLAFWAGIGYVAWHFLAKYW